MNRSLFKALAAAALVGLVFGLLPPLPVYAAEGTISGAITGVAEDYGPFDVGAGAANGGHTCNNTQTTWDGSKHVYTLQGCDDEKDYDVSAWGRGFTFNTVPVTDFIGGTATAPDITPVDRVFTGKVLKDGGLGWEGFELHYAIDGAPGTTTTGGGGVFTIPGVNDGSIVEIRPWEDHDGYWFRTEQERWDPPLGKDIHTQITAFGERQVYGLIDAPAECRIGVTITVSKDGAITKSAVSSATGGYEVQGLEPLAGYTVTPSKGGCTFYPPTDTVSLIDGRKGTLFTVPRLSLSGRVLTTLPHDPPRAYYLIATYTTGDYSYSATVNWMGGEFRINDIPPNAGGTLTISRIGGPAAFGYDPASASIAIPPMTTMDVYQDITLQPNRTITGTLVGQRGVAVQRDATVYFGYGLTWQQTGVGTNFAIANAQPRVYYLSPSEDGILSSNPNRKLVNLMTAASANAGAFNMTLRTYRMIGCIFTRYNDKPLLSSNSVRLRPRAGSGTGTYQATLLDQTEQYGGVDHNCGLEGIYFEIRDIPQGVAGALEFDNHLAEQNVQIGPIINDEGGRSYHLYGDRSLTGKFYVANNNIWRPHPDWELLTLRDTATNKQLWADREWEWNSWEFSFPLLERKAYTLTINPDLVPPGYDANLFPMNQIIPADLTRGDYDVPGNQGFILTHKPIDPAQATGAGYFMTGSGESTYTVNWAHPETNPHDKIWGYELQVAPLLPNANSVFTDASPAPIFVAWDELPDPDNPSYQFTGLSGDTNYRWRLRVVYEFDKGPWMLNAPVQLAPENNALFSGAADNIQFEWEAIPGAIPVGVRYVVQYSTTPTFAGGTVTRPAVDGTTNASAAPPALRTVLYWRVKAVNAAGRDIGDWSPARVFYNRFTEPLIGEPFFRLIQTDFDPRAIQFYIADGNTTLPANSIYYYYQVQFKPAGDGWGDVDDNNSWTFTRVPNALATPRAPQDIGNLASGDYNYRVRIVAGNDHRAPAVTEWTEAGVTFNIP